MQEENLLFVEDNILIDRNIKEEDDVAGIDLDMVYHNVKAVVDSNLFYHINTLEEDLSGSSDCLLDLPYII